VPTSREYRRGELAALRRVRKWLLECCKRNLEFQVDYPDAPKWQLLTAKYGALTQDSHVQGLDRMIEKSKKLRRSKRVVGRNSPGRA
jgi:hypothetical protein